jgi:hypothetical protein
MAIARDRNGISGSETRRLKKSGYKVAGGPGEGYGMNRVLPENLGKPWNPDRSDFEPGKSPPEKRKPQGSVK